MPFIGKDWRSPGEAWVKTESLGWQRMKIIESQLHPTCQQKHLVCSWPPQSQFGQHMAKNCSTENNAKSLGCCGGSLSSDNSGGCTSSESSCSGSTSTSPTGSPEKNNSHHLHPITISSPYGKYSCYAHHHHSLESSTSPSGLTSKESSAYHYQDNLKDMNESHCPSVQMSRSLSPEFVQTTMQHVTLQSAVGQKLRFNNSCSNLEDLNIKQGIDYNGCNNFQGANKKTCNSAQVAPPSLNDMHMAEQLASLQKKVPILMRDGSPIDVYDPISTSATRCDKLNDDIKANFSTIGTSCCCCCSTNQQLFRVSNIEQQPRTAPHCRISVRTREVAMYQTISEAFYRLDFCNAIHDIRRFNYICKLLHLLITQNLTSLSGCATKVLFTMLEQVAWEVSTNKRNIHVLKNLLSDLRQMIKKYSCWGRPIGSTLLWQQHFDTIERISQIVDGIELSPPKDDGNRITFDKLPTEMVREILLRLNDYRDLVNSAQASPLMRTMIDSQYIWQKLCRYHFTDQQLRLALKSYDLSKSNSLSGVKYARTASADGQSSYRNPVAHNSNDGRSAVEGNSARQIERASTQRTANQDSISATSSSYVTETIRIFNRDGSSPSLSCSNRGCDNQPNMAQKSLKKGQNSLSGSSKRDTRNNKKLVAERDDSITKKENRANNGLDWERVFHQLRKKYDLKEEYADCLLLCRHCRCLFWKSFGHPCIKNDDHLPKKESDASFTGQNGLPASVGILMPRNGHLAQSNESVLIQDENYVPNDESGRPNVAALSRNFDRGLNRLVSQNAAQPNLNQLERADIRHRHLVRQPLNDANARLRGQIGQEILLNNGNNNRLRAFNQVNNINSTIKQGELIPKHVTITPQAFLKFFSL